MLDKGDYFSFFTLLTSIILTVTLKDIDIFLTLLASFFAFLTTGIKLYIEIKKLKKKSKLFIL